MKKWIRLIVLSFLICVSAVSAAEGGSLTVVFPDCGETEPAGQSPGADSDGYRALFESYLNGRAASGPEADDETVSVCLILVLDQNGNPVPNVFVNFCTDTTCELTCSDENGVIAFEGLPYAYHLAVLRVPAGYAFTAADDLYTASRSCCMILTVVKE